MAAGFFELFPSLVLLPNWRQVLFGSWSSRLGFAATVLGILEFALPFFEIVVPSGLFAVLSTTTAALIPLVRVFQQRALELEQAEAKTEAVKGA